MDINFYVQSDRLTSDIKQPISGNVNFYRCVFTFSEEWNITAKYAVFSRSGKTYTVELEENACFIPAEVLTESGYITIGVFGTNGSENDYLRISSNAVTVYVGTGAYEDGETPAPPTPDVWEEIKTELDNLSQKAEETDKRISEAEADVNELTEDMTKVKQEYAQKKNVINCNVNNSIYQLGYEAKQEVENGMVIDFTSTETYNEGTVTQPIYPGKSISAKRDENGNIIHETYAEKANAITKNTEQTEADDVSPITYQTGGGELSFYDKDGNDVNIPHAKRATGDDVNRNIRETYATKDELKSAVDGIDLSDCVRFTDTATAEKAGVVKVAASSGIEIGDDGNICVKMATSPEVALLKEKYHPIVPANLAYAVERVMTGEDTLSTFSNALRGRLVGMCNMMGFDECNEAEIDLLPFGDIIDSEDGMLSYFAPSYYRVREDFSTIINHGKLETIADPLSKNAYLYCLTAYQIRIYPGDMHLYFRQGYGETKIQSNVNEDLLVWDEWSTIYDVLRRDFASRKELEYVNEEIDKRETLMHKCETVSLMGNHVQYPTVLAVANYVKEMTNGLAKKSDMGITMEYVSGTDTKYYLSQGSAYYVYNGSKVQFYDYDGNKLNDIDGNTISSSKAFLFVMPANYADGNLKLYRNLAGWKTTLGAFESCNTDTYLDKPCYFKLVSGGPAMVYKLKFSE